MKSLKYAMMGAALAMISQAALAFQETGGKAPPQASEPSVQIEPGKGVNLNIPTDRGARGGGTEIKIPGLGTVGALPKLDFGLELLYGVTEPKGTPAPDRSENGDLQIRGTVKYKFNN